MFELQIEDGLARLTLVRPEARNAVTVAGWGELAERIGEAAAAGARLLIVCGSGGAFSAGADLGEFEAMRGDSPACADFRTAMRFGLDALREAEFPTIALVEGPCYGAGVALAMACDLRFAAPDAVFAITPAKMGISYPQEDVHALVALVGPGQAARLLFSGAPVDAAEALRIGLVDLPAEALDGLTGAILANDPGSLAVLKRGIRLAAGGVRFDSAQDREFDAMIGSDAFAARLSERRRR
jgi:enoyl-CoA hydratase/carnithine racemase